VRHETVHHLVARAFIGERPDGLQVCHGDGNKTNNAAANLRYDSISANVRDSVEHGTQVHARKTKCSQGHAFDAANTKWVNTPSGRGRQCRICHRERMREYRASRRAAA
jgi:hypothetical protein